MRRRDFITFIGGSQRFHGRLWRMPSGRDGDKGDRRADGFCRKRWGGGGMVAAFRNALPKLGWTGEATCALNFDGAAIDTDRIKALAKELVDLQPRTRSSVKAHHRGLVLLPARRRQLRSCSCL